MFKLLLSIILVISAGVVSFFWSKDFYDAIQQLKAEKADFAMVFSNTRALQDRRDALNDEYKKIAPSEMNAFNKVIPERIEPVKIIMEMENLVQKSGMIFKGVNIGGIDTGKTTKKTPSAVQRVGLVFDSGEEEKPSTSVLGNVGAMSDTIKPTTLSLTFTGSYNSFLGFLKRAENSLRLMDIKKISFASGEIDFYEFNIEAVIYSRQ